MISSGLFFLLFQQNFVPIKLLENRYYMGFQCFRSEPAASQNVCLSKSLGRSKWPLKCFFSYLCLFHRNPRYTGELKLC